MPSPHTWADRIGRWYLIYLALLPAVGTVALVGFLKITVNPLVFLCVGTAGVGIYLAMTGSYTKLSRNPWRNLLMFLDGPIWAIGTLAVGGSLATVVVNDILIEISAGLLGLFAVVLTSYKPSRDQRIASIFAVGIPLLGAGWLLYLYGRDHLVDGPWTLVVLAAAVVQGAFLQFRLANADEVHQDAEILILIGIIAWLASLFLGYWLASL